MTTQGSCHRLRTNDAGACHDTPCHSAPATLAGGGARQPGNDVLAQIACASVDVLARRAAAFAVARATACGRRAAFGGANAAGARPRGYAVGAQLANSDGYTGFRGMSNNTLQWSARSQLLNVLSMPFARPLNVSVGRLSIARVK